MWGRPHHTDTLKKASISQPSHAITDLLKPSEWESLADADRHQLTAAFPAFSLQADRGEPLLRANAPAALQDWLGAIVARSLQPNFAAGLRNWLDVAPPTAHLYAGGALSLGTPQLVAAVVRQKVADWPTPPSYCLVPDPDALATGIWLTLPLGTGAAFGKMLSDALMDIIQQWDDAANRQPTLTTRFDTLQRTSPAAAQDYLGRLRAALSQRAASDAALPWDSNDNTPPVGSIGTEPDVTSGAPVVDATASNASVTDLMLQANGGVLIVSPTTIDIGQLLTALVARQVSLSDSLPPLPVTVRVVMLGLGDAYNELWSKSELIPQLFRYEIWSQGVAPWTRDSEAGYAAYAAGVAAYYGLPTPSAAAVGRLIQEGARRTDGVNRNRLSVDLFLLHDIVVEAGNGARARQATTILGEDVEAALDQRIQLQRSSVYWVQEGIISGQNITPTVGTAVGQINGLGVLETHPWEGIFAVPMRISATVAPGMGEQLLDVECEASQADDSHLRGLLTMEGYFASQYAQKAPLSLAARIRFEQEHGATGGDSASAAELFALLSALSDIPIRRSLAVTGAVGQYGELQPIGGVNFKIEGFWDLCRVKRNLGEQQEGGYGVIFPATNMRDLMLREAVALSIVSEGWFHIWPVNTVDEAIPLLMGVATTTLHDRVEKRLHDYAAAQSLRSRSNR